MYAHIDSLVFTFLPLCYFASKFLFASLLRLFYQIAALPTRSLKLMPCGVVCYLNAGSLKLNVRDSSTVAVDACNLKQRNVLY